MLLLLLLMMMMVVVVVVERFKVGESTAEKGNLRFALFCTKEPYLLKE